MKSLSLLPLLLASIVAGCLPEVVPYPGQSSVERSYVVGVPRTISPGEPMVTLRHLTSAPLYEVASDYLPPQHDPFGGGLDYPQLTKGMRFAQVATSGDEIGLARYGYGVTRSASFGRDTYMPVTIWVKDGIVTGRMEGRRWTTDMLFLPMRGTSGITEAARMELVLDRVDGTVIDATHREFFAGPETPTVSRPVRFDIGSNRRFSHEGLEFEVGTSAPGTLTLTVVDDARSVWK